MSYFAKTIAKCNFRTVLFPWYEYSLSYELSQIEDTLRRKMQKDYSADAYATDAQKYHADGFIERYPVDSENFNYGGLHEFSTGQVREEQMEWMRRLIDLCKKEDIRFVCVEAPIPGATLKHFSNGVQESNRFFGEFFSENEVDFLNFNDPEQDLYKAFTHKVNAYTDLVNMVRQYQPDAKIILQGIMSVSRSYAKNGSSFSPSNINKINDEIRALADGSTIFYIDVNEFFADEEGYLIKEVSGDGCHPNGKYYGVWANWIAYAVGQIGI